MKNYFFEKIGYAPLLTVFVLWNLTLIGEEGLINDNTFNLVMYIMESLFIIWSIINICVDTVRYRKWKRKKPWGQ